MEHIARFTSIGLVCETRITQQDDPKSWKAKPIKISQLGGPGRGIFTGLADWQAGKGEAGDRIWLEVKQKDTHARI
jgi:hypothetical protein